MIKPGRLVKRSLGHIRELCLAPVRYASNAIDEPAIILAYHRVAKLNCDPQMLAVYPEVFCRHMEWLARHCTLLTADAFLSCLRRGTFPRRGVLLTFDDGYADNLHQALPVLEALRAQAIFFVTTSNIGTARMLWWDSLESILLSERPLPRSLSIPLGQRICALKTGTRKERRESYDRLHRLMKYCSPESREEALDWLSRWSGISLTGNHDHRLLSRDEVRRLHSSAAAVIGAHGDTHTPLSMFDYRGQLEEIGRSRAFLEAELNAAVRYFSYPFGTRRDYNRDSVRACTQLGFVLACANRRSQVHRWTAALDLPRMIVRNWSEEVFARKVSAFFRY